MFLMKAKLVLTFLLFAGVATLGGGLVLRGAVAADPALAPPEQRPAAAEEDARPLPTRAKPPGTAATASDRDQLQGVWNVVYAERNGQPFHDETCYTFTADSVLIRPRSDVAYPYTLCLSGDKRTITIGTGGEAQKGIYLLDAEVLVHRYAYDSFDDNEQRRHVTMLRVLRRDPTASRPPRRTAAAEQQHARAEAVALLRTARNLLAQGKFDEAERLAARARRSEVPWGLFEDSPDKLLSDLSRAKQSHGGVVRGPASDEDVRLSKPRPAGHEQVYEVGTREMKIPVLVSSERRAELKYLALLMSTDQGRTWQMETTISPDEDAFSFRAPRDGLYWLAVQTVHLDGTRQPSEGRSVRPNLKILVKSNEAKGH